VVHEIEDANGLGEAVARNVELVRQVIVDRIGETQLAPLGELHDRDPRERLRDRAHAEQRAPRIDLVARRHLVDAVALHQQRLAVADDGYLRARDPLIGHDALDHAVDESFEAGHVARWRRLRLDRSRALAGTGRAREYRQGGTEGRMQHPPPIIHRSLPSMPRPG
jgi:hypothetical protein